MNRLQVNIQSELEHKENGWLNALQKQDIPAIAEILHDQFTSTSARSSDVVDKREYLASVPQLRIHECELRVVSVYSIENVAIVKARLICDSTAAERDIHDDLLITDTWMKLGDAWKAITRHASCSPDRLSGVQDSG